MNYVSIIQEWTALKDVYVTRYEDVIADISQEIGRVARFLNLLLSDDEKSDIASRLSIENQKKTIARFQKQGSFVTYGPNKFDPDTLLHLDHINGGDVGRWKKALLPDEIAFIEQKYGVWLQEHNYL